MTLIRKMCLGTLVLGFAFAANVMADDKIKASEFVEEASAKGLAEIETSRIALKESNSSAVRKFAETMISDHTKANQELKKIAQKKNLDVSDEPELRNKAKAMVLKMRDGESFDEAYANNQVVAHEQSIELFQRAANGQDAEIKAYAKKTLPKLQQHLKMAQELQSKTKKDQRNAYDSERETINTTDRVTEHSGH